MPNLKDIAALSDEEILERYRSTGNRDLVGELYRRYTRFVFLVCMKYLEDEDQAKDAAMQIFEDLFSGLIKHEVRSFKPWLHTVAKNHCLYQLRSSKQFQLAAEDMKKGTLAGMESGYDPHLDDGEEQRLKDLEDAILQLSKEQRLCIELFYLRKMPYREIVERTGHTYDQVKSYIQNGKRNLKILLTNRDER